MIHLVTRENRNAYQQLLAGYHRVRKRVFVDELGWQLEVKDGLEKDEYDDDRAMYAIGFDIDGVAVMSGRFRPADDRSMLTDHFTKYLAPNARPINESRTWEFSRAFSCEFGQKEHNLKRKAACMLTPLEVAFRHGVDRFVGFSDLRVLPFFDTMGWKIRLLGEPATYGEGVGVAYEVEVSEQAIADMRKTWRLPDPCHVELTLQDLSEKSPLDKAAEIAERNAGLAQLMPQLDNFSRRNRATKRDYSDYAVARRRAIERIRRNEKNVNYREGISS